MKAPRSKSPEARRSAKSSIVRESCGDASRKQSAAKAVSCHDLARDFAGKVNGLPEDLADNPKYMDGFGG